MTRRLPFHRKAPTLARVKKFWPLPQEAPGERMNVRRGSPWAAWILAGVGMVALTAGRADAGRITLGIDISTTVRDGGVAAEVRLTNRGDEAAHGVMVTGRLGEERQVRRVAESLAPGLTRKVSLTFGLPPPARGTFPLFLIVTYRDANGAPFSSAALGVVRTAGAKQADLNLTVTRGKGARWADLRLNVRSADPHLERATVTCHAPNELIPRPGRAELTFRDGRATVRFRLKNKGALPGSRYAVFFAVEYDREGLHYLARTAASLPVPQDLASQWGRSWVLLALAGGAIWLAALVVSLLSRRARGAMAARPGWVRLVCDLVVLCSVEAFILANLSPRCLLTPTITTGGDTASHYYTAEYLREVCLPAGRISYWTPGNYAGFPILQFYFPLPFLIMCGLDLVMPLQVAFKWVTLLGTFLLPVAAYLMLRVMRCPFPAPGLAAAFTLPFLFNASNSMWGGNILSTLAGEFSYSLSMALSLILLGCLYRGCRENRWVVLNAALVFLVGFSHGYTLLFAEAMSVFLLLTPRGVVRRVVYLGKVYGLGFCFLAFWLVPLLAYAKYTTPYHTVWVLQSTERLLPALLVPLAGLAVAGGLGLLACGAVAYRSWGAGALRALGFLWFGMAAAGVLYVAAPRLGVVDIRYVPYAQLIACLLAALALGWTGRAVDRWGLGWALLLSVAAGTIAWTGPRVGAVPTWARWNYEGFEAKPAWPTFERINAALRGTFQDPRVAFEHSSLHNTFGTTRAFESLPLFAGRATLEGLYMQASISAPFVFYIQSEISKEKSAPFPQYTYSSMNFDRARAHLEMFNVRDLILRSEKAKQAIRSVPGYRLKRTIGPYEIWEVTTNPNCYVLPLRYEPVLFPTRQWKAISHRWFREGERLDVPLVFVSEPDQEDLARFRVVADSLKGVPRIPIQGPQCKVEETVRNGEVLIRTDRPGRPLLVKMSYHPNWHVDGAKRVYLASPSFMLIFPERREVRLYYGRGLPERVGLALTVVGLLAVVAVVQWPGRRSAWQVVAERLGVPASLDPHIRWDPSQRVRRALLVAVLLVGASAAGAACYQLYTHEPHRLFNRAIRLKDAKEFRAARAGFREVMEALPTSGLAADAAYYIAICYYLGGDDPRAIAAFRDLISRYPRSLRVPEAEYHIGLCLLRSRREKEGIAQMQRVRREFPESQWARYAAERLKEHGVTDFRPEEQPRSLAEQYGLAIRLFNQDRLDEAEPLLEKIVSQRPDFEGAPQALACLALCRFKRKDYRGTIRYYTRLTRQYPESALVAEAWYHIGLCSELLGDTEAALRAYRTAAEKFPDAEYGKRAAQRLARLRSS